MGSFPQWFTKAQLAHKNPVKVFGVDDHDLDRNELRACLRYVTAKYLEAQHPHETVPIEEVKRIVNGQ